MAHSSTKIYVGDGTGIRLQQDLQVFFGIVGGLGYIISQLASRTNGINVWAKYKPIRSNSVSAVTENDRKLYFYGISRDSSTGYWSWNYPRGGSDGKYRMLDFNGYNSAALCPVKDIAGAYIPEDINPASDEILIRYDKLFNFGVNVELPLKELPSIYTQTHYVGLLFVNNTRGSMHTYTISDTVATATDESASHSYGNNISLSTLGYQSGDSVDVYVCCFVNNTNGQPVSVTSSDISNGRLIKMALAANRGKASFTCYGWSLNNISYDGSSGVVNSESDAPKIYTYYTISGTTATFSSFGIVLRDTNTYTAVSNIRVRLGVSVESSSATASNYVILSSNNVHNNYIDSGVLRFSCNLPINFGGDPSVSMFFTLYVYDSSDNIIASKELTQGYFNVNTRYWSIGTVTDVLNLYWNDFKIHNNDILTFSTNTVILEDKGVVYRPYTASLPSGIGFSYDSAGYITLTNISSLGSTPQRFTITNSIGMSITFTASYSA